MRTQLHFYLKLDGADNIASVIALRSTPVTWQL